MAKHIKLSAGSRLNINKKGLSTTTKLPGGGKMTSGMGRVTITPKVAKPKGFKF